MSDSTTEEPEKEIEKQIRAYARARREETGGVFSMHPTARNLLQKEVADTYPQAASERPHVTPAPVSVAGGGGFWELFQRQLVYFAGVVAAVALGAFAWYQFGPGAAPHETAMAGTSNGGEPPITPPLEMVNVENAVDPPGAPEPTPEPASPAPVPRKAAPSMPVASPAPKPSPAAPPAETAPVSGVSQRFAAAAPDLKYRRNFNSPPPPAILRTFDVRQSGTRVDIVDLDGSTYTGVVANPPEPIAVGAELRFSARGLNRSLNRQVEIDGALQLEQADDGTSRMDLRVSSSRQLPLKRFTIRARVKVEGGSQFPVSAAPSGE